MKDCPPANPLNAAFYADQAVCETVEVVANEQVAAATYKLSFASPRMAARFLPGQFLMIRISGTDDPLIGRPLALYDIVAHSPPLIEVVYLVQGNLTTQLARLPRGSRLEVWGPLGNGFAPRRTQHLIMVAGGIGYTPFLSVAKQYLGRAGYAGDPPAVHADRVTLCYGARSADLLAGVEAFQSLGVQMRLATDDGSAGHQGLVTEVFESLDSPDETRVVCCGPELMMEAVAKLCASRGWPCQVSLETPMACGIGICFTCVTRVRDAEGDWDYQRTCVDGPVFDAEIIEW